MSTTLRQPVKKAAKPAKPAPAPRVVASEEQKRQHAERERQEHLAAVQRRRERTKAALALFRERWPAVFTTHVPLAVGVAGRIRAELPEITVAHLKEALQFWTRSVAYQRALAAGVERRNLDGSTADVPDEEQREHAAKTLRDRGIAVEGPNASPQ